MDLRPGTQIGDYELVSFIGRGGMAQVWSIRNREGRSFAVKTLRPEFANDVALQERLLREASNQCQLVHPSILRAYGTFTFDNQTYILMELVDGESLETYLARHHTMPPPEVSDIARPVLSALGYAHARQIVHRDVKPSNILLSRSGSVLLGDFGIALLLGQRRLTKFGAMGTPDYMSPEQIRTPLKIDHRSDIYSFACVLYELLTGHPPFFFEAGANDYLVREAHLTRTPAPVSSKRPDVPPAFDRAILRALEKDPAARFQTCEDFALNLGVRIAANQPPSVKRVQMVEGLRPTPKANTPYRAAVGTSQTPMQPSAPEPKRGSTPHGRVPMTPAVPATPPEPDQARERAWVPAGLPYLLSFTAGALLLIVVSIWKFKGGSEAGRPSPPARPPVTAQIEQAQKPIQAAPGEPKQQAESRPAQSFGKSTESAVRDGRAAGEPDTLDELRRAYDELQKKKPVQVAADPAAVPSRPKPLQPSLLEYQGPSAGTLQWVGPARRGSGPLVIDAARSGNGVLTGDALPGVPVRITIEEPEVSVSQQPGLADGYRRMVLQVPPNLNPPIHIRWRVIKGGE